MAQVTPPNVTTTPDAARGRQLLASKGCLACHSLDGTARAGPTFRGLWGSTRQVHTGGAPRKVVVDEEYLARSLRDPDADVVVGYPRGHMPRFDVPQADVRAIADALRDVREGAAEPVVVTSGSSTPLAVSAAAFVVLHLVLSSGAVRRRLVDGLGPKGFSGAYSALVLAAFGAMLFFYRSAPHVDLWLAPRWTRWVPLSSMPIAILLMIAGFSTPGPTTANQAHRVSDERAVRGVHAVTRHPALWGFAIWALSHLVANGELRVVLVAGAIASLALLGMLHIDRRRARDLGEAWVNYCERTSLVPFVALARGRAKLRLADIGWIRIVVAVVVYVAILHTHALVIGASPFP